MGEERLFGVKFLIFSHLIFNAPQALGLDAIGSPRAPLPDPSLKKYLFNGGPSRSG